MTVQQSPRLGRNALLFPLCLVLYEFATYIANDMIQPGMPTVVAEFNAAESWIPTSMTAYLAGGIALQWLLGPLSDRIGRRPVMLVGVLWFVATCLMTLFAGTIEQFMLLRFLQGISLCFIGAVGYAAVQDAFEEATCIKITALMANVALIAPLFGPLAGSAWVHFLPWSWMFILFSSLAFIAFVGLFKAMPETATRRGERLSMRQLFADYRIVLSNRGFLAGAVALGCVSLPLLAWIAESPVMIMSSAGTDSYRYGWMQVPIFGALIAGNLLLARLTSRFSVRAIIWTGSGPIVAGLATCALVACYYPDAWWAIVAGLSLYGFGIGIANAGLVRLTLFASPMSKGTVSAALGMIQMVIFTVGIEVSQGLWQADASRGFTLFNFAAGLAWLGLVRYFLRGHRGRATPGVVSVQS